MKRDEFEKVLEYALKAPIVVDPRWNIVPEKLRDMALPLRILHSLDCVKNQRATEFEALIYLHTASMSQPLSDEWARIYMWLFRKYFPEKAKRINVPEVTLNSYEKHLLDQLRYRIFKTQMKHIRGSVRGKRGVRKCVRSEYILISRLG